MFAIGGPAGARWCFYLRRFVTEPEIACRDAHQAKGEWATGPRWARIFVGPILKTTIFWASLMADGVPGRPIMAITFWVAALFSPPNANSRLSVPPAYLGGAESIGLVYRLPRRRVGLPTALGGRKPVS